MRLTISLIIVWAVITYLLIPLYKHYHRVKESEKKRIRKELSVEDKHNKNNESESEWYEF